MKKEYPVAQAHRLLAPRPTCLLTSSYRGRVNVMALAWVGAVSLQPSLVMMAIHPSRYSHDLLKRGEQGVLNIPGRALAEQVCACGAVSGQDEDKFQLTKLTPESGHRVEVPWISECLAHLECTVVNLLAPGDHTVFVAEVVGIWAEEEAFDGMWRGPQDNDELHPLVHLGGKEFCLLGKRVTVV